MLPRSRRFALLALLALTGCASHHRLGLQLPADNSAEVLVGGHNPFVQVANDGPGRLDVETTDGTGAKDTTQLLRGSLARNLRGGGLLRLTAVGDTVTAVVVVDDSSGVSLQRPATTHHATKP